MKLSLSVLCLGLAGLSMLGLSVLERDPKILYNPSPSAPIGWYKISDSNVFFLGDRVAAWLPEDAQKLALERKYLPQNIPVIKTVAAVPGDEFCVENGILLVEGKSSFTIHTSDSKGRVMPVLPAGCRRLSDVEYLLLSGRVETSFDSRYFGPVDHSAIIGRAQWIGKSAGIEGGKDRSEGGARGSGVQGKIKGHGTNPSLSHCLHIDFYSTILNDPVPLDRSFCNSGGVFQQYQISIDHDLSLGPRL